MKKKILSVVITIKIYLFICLFILACNRSDKNHITNDMADKFIKIEKLKDSILQVKLGYDAVTAIKTTNGIIIIDAGISNSLTSKYRKLITAEFNQDNFIYLINTHSHPDHIGGNQVFADAIIIAQENSIAEINENFKSNQKTKLKLQQIADEYDKKRMKLDSGSRDWLEAYCQKIRYQHAADDLMNDRIITMPGITFSDKLNITLKDLSLKLIYFGNAHSNSDILIHIPQKKILLIGDLFSHDGITHIDSTQYLSRWESVKQWITDCWNDTDMIIGGHGEILLKTDLESFINNIDKEYNKK